MHAAVVTFTARPLQWILDDGGSRDWRLDADRARRCEFLVCTQNRHNADFGAPAAPHGSAFLIGRIAAVVRSPERHDRWLIKIREYVECNLPNIWAKSGHLRYPVWYTTLEDLGIDLQGLGPFQPVPQPDSTRRAMLSDAPNVRRSAGRQGDWERLDAILDQIDRIHDQPEPFDPLEWDNHGLPR
jgi:hypothetical protein